MILDGANPEHRKQIASTKYDVCIAGAGAAGLTMAMRFATQSPPRTVIILESAAENEQFSKTIDAGSHPRYRDRYPKIRRLDDPASDQGRGWWRHFNAHYFTESRTRAIGGSTNCWGGFIRPLDASDFDGWPISRDALKPFYRDAFKLMRLTDVNGKDYFDDVDDPAAWAARVEGEIRPLPNTTYTRTVILARQTDACVLDFQDHLAWTFLESKNITLVRNATVIDFPLTFTNKWQASKMYWTSLDVANNTKIEGGEVTARHFVLAMGGLEIPRFLLESLEKTGFKSYDEIGRRYMMHPRVQRAVFNVRPPITDPAIDQFYQTNALKHDKRIQIQGVVVPTPDGMTKFGTRNFRLAVGIDSGFLELNFEQAPNPASRVTLTTDSNDTDAFGRRRAVLDWQFLEADVTTVMKSVDLFQCALKLITKGDVETSDLRTWTWNKDDPYPSADTFDTDAIGHHMGTCRMNSSKDTQDGVVDGDCKVNQFGNLWICSTAVYPTVGWANATGTLLALALRLADHLAEQLDAAAPGA